MAEARRTGESGQVRRRNAAVQRDAGIYRIRAVLLRGSLVHPLAAQRIRRRTALPSSAGRDRDFRRVLALRAEVDDDEDGIPDKYEFEDVDLKESCFICEGFANENLLKKDIDEFPE